MRNNVSLKKQKGVIIILAMLMVALMASMAYLMLEQAMYDTKRTAFMTRDVSANLMANGAVLWAKDALTQDWMRQKPTQRVDVMPMHLPESVVQGYRVSAVLQDAQAKYNINNLMNEGADRDFMSLLKAVAPQMNDADAIALSKNTVLWLRPVMTNDTLDRYYAELPQPYRAGHRLMSHVSELKSVKGMTSVLYAALWPVIVALPETTTINPQTASVPVLMALSPSMTADTAETFVRLREQAPVLTNEAFKALPLIANHAINTDKIGMISHYFQLQTTVSLDDAKWMQCALLVRAVVNGRAVVRMLYQNKGEC
jgi:general secretion pathway protein K